MKMNTATAPSSQPLRLPHVSQKGKALTPRLDVFPPFIVYENPHYYDVPRQEVAVPDPVTQNIEATNGNNTPMDHQIFQMLDSLDSRNHLEEVEVDARITTSLLR